MMEHMPDTAIRVYVPGHNRTYAVHLVSGGGPGGQPRGVEDELTTEALGRAHTLTIFDADTGRRIVESSSRWGSDEWYAGSPWTMHDVTVTDPIDTIRYLVEHATDLDALQVAALLGYTGPHRRTSSHTQMRRWSIRPDRRDRTTGESLWPGDMVRRAIRQRPGQGARTDLADPPREGAAPPVVTAEHIHDLLGTVYDGDETVLVATDEGVEVWAEATAKWTHHRVMILAHAQSVWDQCDGELDDQLAAQIAASLTEET